MRYTVLVIDDQWSMQELARIVLHTAGYRVLLASDTITGLCLARTEHPDVAVLDLHLAERQDDAFLAEWQQDPKTAKIPLIAITAPQMPVTPLPFGYANAPQYLQKPFRAPELLVMVDRMLHVDDLPIAV